MAENTKKLLILNIAEVLHRFTDKNHKLTQNEIASLVKGEFGLDVERKAVARNIEALQNTGFDIGVDGGYYLKSRHIAETTVLGTMLALGASSLISRIDAKCIASDLTKKSSTYFKENLIDFDVNTSGSFGINLQWLNDALLGIRENKKLTFLCPPYLVHGKSISRSGKYTILPRAIYVEDGVLVLAGFNQNQNPIGFNMLGITDLEITPSRQKSDDLMSTEALMAQLKKPASDDLEAVFKVGACAMELFVCEFGANLIATTDDSGKSYTVRQSAPRAALKKVALLGASNVTLLSPSSLQDEIVEEIIGMAGSYT